MASSTVSISYKPGVSPSSVTVPTRTASGGKKPVNELKSTWKVPSNATSNQRNDRWEKLTCAWHASVYGTYYVYNKKTKKKDIKKTGFHDVDLSGGIALSLSATANTYKMNRLRYYPCVYTTKVNKGKFTKNTTKKIKVKKNGKWVTEKRTYKKGDPLVDEYGNIIKVSKKVNGPKVSSVTFHLLPGNCKGSGKLITKTRSISAPSKPSISFEYDEETGIVTITIVSKDSDSAERYDLIYKVTRKDNGVAVGDATDDYSDETIARDSSGNKLSGTKVLFGGSDTITLNHNINVSQVPYGGSVTINVSATARGMRGDTSASNSFVYQNPDPMSIKKIVVQQSNKDLQTTAGASVDQAMGQVLVYYGYGSNNSAKYATGYKLQNYVLERAVTDESVTKSAIATAQGDWTSDIDKHSGSYSDANVKNSNGVREGAGIMGEPVAHVLAAMQGNESTKIYGKRVWYRIKSERQGLVRYSAAKEAIEFYVKKPSMQNDYSGFVCIDSGDNGTAIDTVVGWDAPTYVEVSIEVGQSVSGYYTKSGDNYVAATGSAAAGVVYYRKIEEVFDTYKNNPAAKFTTEVSYSEYENAWKSNQQPSAYEFDWTDTSAEHTKHMQENIYNDSAISSEKIAWQKSGSLSVKGLEAGKPYYLKTRRHVVLDDIDEYGPYTSAPTGYWPYTPYDTPSKVDVGAPDYLEYGKDLEVSWTTDSASPQKSFAIYHIRFSTESQYTEDTAYGTATIQDLEKVLIGGSDEDNSKMDIFSVPWESMETKGLFVDANPELHIAVGVSTGGEEALSCVNSEGKYTGSKIIPVAMKPDCALIVPSVLTAKPLSFRILTNVVGVSASVSLRCKGITLSYPDGDVVVPEDDYVWSDIVVSEKFTESVEAGYLYEAEVSIPETVPVYDGATYTIAAHTISPVSKYLVSEAVDGVDGTTEEEVSFTVAYEHQAMPPSIYSRVSTVSTSDGSTQAAIEIVAPDNYRIGDTCSVYRVTPDGRVLIGSGIEFGSTVLDRYPPFSKVANLRYALMTVTSDGDFEWIEIPYVLRRHGLRFDWAENSFVELPYNIELSDAFAKDGEVRVHMDGSRSLVSNPGISRTGTITTQLIRLGSPEQFERVRALAQYPNSVLVRAHDGTCYEAFVQVSSLANNYNSQTSPVKISTQQVDLTDSFMLEGRDAGVSEIEFEGYTYSLVNVEDYLDTEVNPSEEGWYEHDPATDEYFASVDTVLDTGTDYYIQTEL